MHQFSVFNSSKPIVIQADSSKDGLGCCMLQDGSPAAYAYLQQTEIMQKLKKVF
ncbi:hypothetical protein X975_07080, partial [Stegodyphus mimosarum]